MSQSTRVALDSYNLDNAEKLLCEAALQRAGNITGAAELLGIDRKVLARKIAKHKITWPEKRLEKAANTPPPQTKRRLN